MTEEERQSIIDEIKEQLLADMVDITKLPKGDATDGASLPVLQHSELVIQELNNFIGVYDIDVERQSADSDIVNIYLKNAAGVVIKTIVTNAATLEQVNTKVAKINESLTLISSSLSAKQDTLKSGVNIKTINGTSLLGSGDVVVSGDSTGDVDEGRLVWSTNDIQNNITIMDSMFLNTVGNRLAFCNPAAITIEHSQDGGNTWVSIDNDADKIKLVTPVLGNNNFTIGGSETPPNRDVVQTRVTIDAITANLYFVVKKILIMTIGVTGVDSNAGKPTFCKIEYQTYPNYGTDTWTTYKDIEVIGQPGWNSISTNDLPNFGYASVSHIRLIRFTFYKPNGCGQYIGRLSNIAFLATKLTHGGNTFSKTGHIYEIDVNQNSTFPANIKASDFNGVNISVNNNVKGKTLNVGTNTTLSNSGTAAIGENCSATNPYAIAMGYKAVSSGYYSTAIGTLVTAHTNYQTVIGKYNATSTHAFVIGWGTADAKKNIFSVDTSGNVYGTKFITSGGTNQQVVLGNGSLKDISELSPITDADADILLDNHIHSIDVNANGNNVNISVIESSKIGNNWETEDNNITIPLATPTSAGVMSKEDKAKLDGNISIEPDSGMPDFIGDFEYSDVDYEAIIDLTTIDWINWVEGGLFMMNAEETWEEDNGDASYHQCVVTFIYRSNGCIPISIVNTNKMTAKMSGMVITINLTEGTGELRFKQIKLI